MTDSTQLFSGRTLREHSEFAQPTRTGRSLTAPLPAAHDSKGEPIARAVFHSLQILIVPARLVVPDLLQRIGVSAADDASNLSK